MTLFNSMHAWKFRHGFCPLLFFQNNFVKKIVSGIPTVHQTVWTQVRYDNLSVLIKVQTVCKGNQQTIKIKSYYRVEINICFGRTRVKYERQNLLLIQLNHIVQK